jgi:hypothetical protein
MLLLFCEHYVQQIVWSCWSISGFICDHTLLSVSYFCVDTEIVYMYFFVISLCCWFLICNLHIICCVPMMEGVDKMLQLRTYIHGVNGEIVNVCQIAQHHCYRIMGLLKFDLYAMKHSSLLIPWTFTFIVHFHK